jgi:WD40 repeat protein
VSVSYDKFTRVWDRNTGTQVTAIEGKDFMTRVTLNPKLHQIAVSDGAGRVSLYETKAWSLHESVDIRGSIWALTFTHDGEELLCGLGDGVVVALDAHTLRPRCRKKFHSDYVSSLSQRGDLAVCGSYDKLATVFSVTDFTVHTVFAGHGEWLTATVFLDETRILSGSADHTLRIWTVDGKELVCIDTGRIVRSISQSYDASVIAVGHATGQITYWALRPPQHEMIQVGTSDAHSSDVKVCFSPVSPMLVSGSYDTFVKWFVFE